MTISADPMAVRPGRVHKQTTARRAPKPETGTMEAEATRLENMLWEDSTKLMQSMTGGQPGDSEELDPHDAWLILETVAATLPPAEWGDPHALSDLYQLRKQFTGLEHPELRVLAKQERRISKLIPDPAITPANPDFEALRRRLARSAEPVKAPKPPTDEMVAQWGGR